MSADVLSCLKHSGDDLKYQLSHIPNIYSVSSFFSPEIRIEKIYIIILFVYKSRKQKIMVGCCHNQIQEKGGTHFEFQLQKKTPVQSDKRHRFGGLDGRATCEF